MKDEITLEKETVTKPSIIGMIHSPVEQFKRIKAQPVIWIGLIIVLVLSLINGVIGTFLVEDALAKEFADFGDEELLLISLFTKVVGVISSIIGPIVGILIKTVVLLIIARIVQSTVSFRQLFSMSIYIAVIGTVGLLINTSVSLLSGTNDISVAATSLSTVIHAKGALAGLFSSIEVFSIWTLILTAIGMQVVVGISKKVSWILIISYFVLITLLAMGSMVLLDKFEVFM